jgi:hypothetical protein
MTRSDSAALAELVSSAKRITVVSTLQAFYTSSPQFSANLFLAGASAVVRLQDRTTSLNHLTRWSALCRTQQNR